MCSVLTQQKVYLDCVRGRNNAGDCNGLVTAAEILSLSSVDDTVGDRWSFAESTTEGNTRLGGTAEPVWPTSLPPPRPIEAWASVPA